jgi:hypothetical protein
MLYELAMVPTYTCEFVLHSDIRNLGPSSWLASQHLHSAAMQRMFVRVAMQHTGRAFCILHLGIVQCSLVSAAQGIMHATQGCSRVYVTYQNCLAADVCYCLFDCRNEP